WVLTGSSDKMARLWEVTTGKEIRRFEGHTDWVEGVAFSPDGKQVLTASAGSSRDRGAVQVWDVASGQEIQSFPMGTLHHEAKLVFSPDGKQLLELHVEAEKDYRTTVRLWDLAADKTLHVLQNT